MSASALWDGTPPGGVGGPARSRTGNQAVMSHRLYLLSYRPVDWREAELNGLL